MEFSYNRYSSESELSQRHKFLQNSEYINSITSKITKSDRITSELAKIQNREVKNSINDIKGEMNNLSHTICENLEEGFLTLNESILKNNSSIENISDELNALTNLTFLGFNRLSEEIKITNYILGKIEQLIKVPESQKQRYHYIDEGVKFLLNGFKEGENSKYYEYAIEEFNKSITEIDSKDYFSLYYLGYIRLHIKKLENLAEAENYFSKAGDFFKAEGLIGGTSSANAMNGNNFSYNQRAIESYFNASISCHRSNSIEKAINFCDKALSINPKDLTSLYYKAKYLVIIKRSEDSIEVIKLLINENKYFPIQILQDKDIREDKKVQIFINNLTNEKALEASNKIKEIENIIIDNSKANELIQNAKKLNATNDYFLIITSLEILEMENVYKFERSASKNKDNMWNEYLGNPEYSFNAINLVKYESQNLEIQNLLIQLNQIYDLITSLENKYKIELEVLQAKIYYPLNLFRTIVCLIFGLGLIYWGYGMCEFYNTNREGIIFDIIVAVIFILVGIILLFVGGDSLIQILGLDTYNQKMRKKINILNNDKIMTLTKYQHEFQNIKSKIQNVK